MYMDTKAKTLCPDSKTELFDILAIVLEGDTLAPYLFIIALDYCKTKLKVCLTYELCYCQIAAIFCS